MISNFPRVALVCGLVPRSKLHGASQQQVQGPDGGEPVPRRQRYGAQFPAMNHLYAPSRPSPLPEKGTSHVFIQRVFNFKLTHPAGHPSARVRASAGAAAPTAQGRRRHTKTHPAAVAVGFGVRAGLGEDACAAGREPFARSRTNQPEINLAIFDMADPRPRPDLALALVHPPRAPLRGRSDDAATLVPAPPPPPPPPHPRTTGPCTRHGCSTG